MSQKFSYDEVSKHNKAESCWVILYGAVYDVTDFVPSHPGGAKVILQLAGQDATEEYDPVHPPGLLEEQLKPEAKLGTIDESTLPKTEQPVSASVPATNGGAPSNLPLGPRSEMRLEEMVEAGVFADTPGANVTEPVDLETLLNLDDIEAAATPRLRMKAWAYYYSAADDLLSKRLNNSVYREILLRPRVFVDCTQCDTSTSLLGHKVDVPFYVSPAAMARLAHPAGEGGIAKAAAKFGALQIISNNASQTPEQIVRGGAGGQVFGWQLYVQTDRAKSERMLRRINRLPQIKFVCLTLDAPTPGKREHDERAKNVGASLPVRAAAAAGDAPRQKGKEKSVNESLFAGTASDLVWHTTLAWLAAHTHLPIVLKGVQTHEDAHLASLHAPQVRAVVLSNHGGRALDTAPPAVHTLLEVRRHCPEVFGRLEVWVDGGVRRGTDVVKALCLGARAVGLGRAPLFGLGVGGVEGVERVLGILKAEVETCMRLLGVSRVEELGMKHINARAVERDIYDGEANLERSGLWEKAKAKL